MGSTRTRQTAVRRHAEKAWLARIAGTRVEGWARAAPRGLVAPFAIAQYGNNDRQAFSHITYPTIP